jgi:hypothetical protein
MMSHDEKTKEFETIEKELPDIQSKIKAYFFSGKFKITAINVLL